MTSQHATSGETIAGVAVAAAARWCNVCTAVLIMSDTVTAAAGSRPDM